MPNALCPFAAYPTIIHLTVTSRGYRRRRPYGGLMVLDGLPMSALRRVGPGNFTPSTGSPEAVARPRFPQNVACGFPAPRSSAVGSQLSLLSVQVSFPWSADLLLE